MHPLFARPHLFISYSRADAALAEHLYRSLSAAGFSVYLDREKTLIGENFVSDIVRQLRASDAVVALISEHSARSEWCQAELYHAHALGKMIAPIRVGRESLTQAAPLDLLQRDVNYVVVGDEETYPAAARQIEQRLHSVRRKARLRVARNVVLLAAAAVLLSLAWGFGVRGVNAFNKARERRALAERVAGSTTVFSREVVGAYAQSFPEDDELISRLLLMKENPEMSDTARLNADLVSKALLNPRTLRKRWYVAEVNWQQSDYRDGELTDVTFMKGSVKDVEFDNVTFAGVVWNQAPADGKPGLTLSDLKFENCRFYSGVFGGTGAVKVDFVNSSFEGTLLDISAFGAVNFLTRASEPDSSVITNELGSFKNSVIDNCVEPAAPGVMEIVPPDAEVRFNGVLFSGCRFRGLIRPSWFKDCTFVNCSFPPSVTKQSLEDANIVQNHLTTQESCGDF